MDIGGTKAEPLRQFLQESTTPASSSNLPLDNPRPVALETTPSPLSYWPPSALPVKNGSKDPADGPRSQAPEAGSQNSEETPPASKCEVTHPHDSGPPPRILHHNLPPIAGITSSHNYRGVREVHKQSVNAPEEQKPDKCSTAEPPAENSKSERNVQGKESVAKTDSDKEKPEDGDCEIVEVPQTSSVDRPKTASSDYVFSIPAAVSSAPQTKPLVSPRAPTPFVSSPAPATETLTLNINPSSNMSAGSPSPSGRMAPSPSGRTVPSPSGRTAPSPHFIAPSPTMQSPSPSDVPRILPSTMPSPNLHRVMSSSHVKMPSSGDSPRILGSPHNPPSPSQRSGATYTPNSHSNLTYLNSPRTNFTSSPVQNFNPDPPTQPPRMGLLQTSLPNTTQRINQSTENQICRNPFELPMSKTCYQPEQQMGHPSNVRPADTQYMNLPREQHKLPGFYPPGFKPLPANDAKFKQMNPQPVVLPGQNEQKRTVNLPPKHPDQMGSKPNCGWIRPESSDVAYPQNINKNYNKVNGNEYSNRKLSEVGYHNAVKHPPQENYGGRFGDKQNGSFSQVNSLSQRFPPVPQSNYDLNRHIYDSMNEGGRAVQPQMGRPPEKNQFPTNSQQCKTQPYYRDLPEQDKTKNFMPPAVKAGDYTGSVRHGTYGQFNNLLEKAAQDVYQNKRQNQPPVNPPFPQSSNDSRHSLPSPMPDHHRPLSQSFPPRVNVSHPTDKSKQSQLMFPQKQPEFEGKKLMEVKSVGSAQFPGPQPMIPPVQAKPRTPSSTTTVPVRSKRESPLDLSVKTVRQSADSTAKDDSEVYLQNFRNFMQGQPPRSEARYPVSQSNEGATGAPKIDFTPNFSGFHTDGPATSSHHKPEMSALPPVESFKKFPARLPTPAIQETTKNRTGVNPPKYFSPPVGSPKPPSSTDARYPEHFRGEAQKRSIDDPMRNQTSPAKIPKIDPWKLAFDQQIEQRLNSARMSHQNSQQNSQTATERTVNGMDSSKPSPVPSQYPSTYQRHSGNQYRSANMYPQPPVQTSVTPYNPSYIQQPQCQTATPQTPQEKLQHRENVGHSPDPEQIIKQISKGVMPDHKLLQDKNVLSILRSSLEEKEAKLMQLREVAKRKEKYKELMSDVTKKPFQPFEQPAKGLQQGKQSLPPFGALTLERMCAPPSFPGHRLNLPRPVDTVKIDIEPTQKYFSPAVKNEAEKSGIPAADLSPHDDVQGPPTDLDGLAAFLAARIRTKGELKQVGPALPHHLKTQSAHNAFLSETLDRALGPTHTTTGGFQPNGSPPKLVRESRLLPPLRRRYFSHTEEETPTTSGAQSEDHHPPLPPRDPNGIRSSSETSVFDFRESDSEGEMPVLERQTLEGMRRDRKTFGSKQNVSTTTPDDVIEAEKPEVIAELDKSHPDPFWDTAFDMFVEQLEKRPPKRSVRKKKVTSQVPEESEKTVDGVEKSFVENAEEEKKEGASLVSVKKELEEREKLENVPDGHVKLSSSRLKVYRDEMRLKEEKIEEEKAKPNKVVEKEEEKEKPKGSQTKKKDEVGVKTRGRSKVEEESSAVDFDSDSDERDIRSDSESTAEDDDDSLSLSGLESESSDSESSEESSNSNFSSSDDSENETVARKKQRIQTRLQTRSTRQRQVKGTGMKLRSKAAPVTKATAKTTKKRKKRKEEYYSAEKKQKPVFGDGSEFRPGWEEECYKFKQQLRMPEKLINISRPSKRSTVSLPDLDPYRNSPSLDSSDVSMTKKSENGKAGDETDDSDVDSTKKSRTQEGSPLGSDNNVGSLLKSRNGKKSSQIVNMLVDKYGKGNLKKQKELKAMNERKSPRILPKATNKPELLPTPGLGIGKENVLKDKKRSKDIGKKKLEESDSVYLGYFRRKTVNNFKEAFKQKVGLLPQEFSPVVLKSRTRTQTRDLKKRATLMEVFGEERPASAPPLSREEDTSTDQEKAEKVAEKKQKKKPKVAKKMCGGVVTRGRGKLTRSGRPGLRSTAVLRSNKAVQNSKRHLNVGRKRNMELLRIRAMASKKFSYLVSSSDAGAQLPITKKRLKLKSVRRKFRSGFDYIRKKKKLKKDGDSADGSVKEKKLTVRPTSESVEDIQNEIKNWVINKGLGETILHRAARLGYTDVAAYCLEKMDCSPSPRDNAGYTPLHEACSRGHLEIAKLLLMYGASVSESAKGGIRPLHEAAENGFTELIRLLLSYGADPLLETYTGHTALSLVSDEEARRLIQHHLADVQGNVAPVWTFQGPAALFDLPENGYDPLCDPPSPSSVHSDFELETSEAVLPTLYRLAGDREADRRWVLLRDVLMYTKTKSKEAVLKQLGSSTVREMKLTEFNEQSKSCSILGLGDKPLTKASKVILLPYDDKLRQLLGVEKVLV